LPDELRVWFDLHDGTGYEWAGQLAPDNYLVSVDEAIKATRLTREIWSEFEDARSYADTSPERSIAGTVMATWLPEYVYVGQDTYGGGLFVDTRPGELQGCVREWDKTEADDDYGRGPIATSLADLVVALATALRTDEPFARLGHRATLVDGTLEWSLEG
jgi:cell wall assembly regulator SMI1